MISSPICELLGIKYPIFQGGMAWIADGALAAAVSNAGGLGIITAMNAGEEHLVNEINIAKSLTDKPFGVNIMLMSPFASRAAEIVVEQGVKVVTTGAGSPKKYMQMWKDAGIKVIPVIASVAMAKSAVRAGADAVVAEGQESGGHIGELTTMALVPQVCSAVDVPVISAGGIAYNNVGAVSLCGCNRIENDRRRIGSLNAFNHRNSRALSPYSELVYRRGAERIRRAENNALALSL